MVNLVLNMENIISKIRKARYDKGYSHEYMAHMLNLSPSAYTKIERMYTRLSVERLFRIAEILDISLEHLLNIKAETKTHPVNETIGPKDIDIKILYQHNHESIEKLLKSKDESIENLQNQLEFLKELVKRSIK